MDAPLLSPSGLLFLQVIGRSGANYDKILIGKRFQDPSGSRKEVICLIINKIEIGSGGRI
jgi:hypothetical protein